MTTLWKNDQELYEIAKKELFVALVGDVLDKLGYLRCMKTPRYTPLALSLPSTVPFVGPETQERAQGAAFKARESHKGLSIRVVKDYDIDSDEDVIRLDILYGWKAIYPDLACRHWG